MKKILLFLCLVVVSVSCEKTPSHHLPIENVDQQLLGFYKSKISDVLTDATGEVIKLLSDDNEGSRHQRFIIKTKTGQTILISHNIDIAPRINTLRVGDVVSLFGEYEYNQKGGVIHWTHHDPNYKHPGGWILHNRRKYD